MQMVDTPLMRPTACVCGAHDAGPYVDTEIDNALGRIYLCIRCFEGILRLQELVPGARYDKVVKRAGEAESRLEQLTADRNTAQREASELGGKLQTAEGHLETLRSERRALDAKLVEMKKELRRVKSSQTVADVAAVIGSAARIRPEEPAAA